MWTSALFGAKKTSDFSKFMVLPHGQGGKGSIFRHFVWTSFNLWMVPYGLLETR